MVGGIVIPVFTYSKRARMFLKSLFSGLSSLFRIVRTAVPAVSEMMNLYPFTYLLSVMARGSTRSS